MRWPELEVLRALQHFLVGIPGPFFATQGISTHFCTQIERIGAGAWSVRSWSWWVKLFPPAATSKSLRYSPRLFHVLASGAVSDPIGKCGKRMKTLFLCLLLDLVSWGFGYPTNLEHATSLSLVCTSFLQEMMLRYDTLTGILFLRSLMLSIMYGWFSHPKNLMKDLVKMANKRRWRWEKRGFGGKALWNHIIKKNTFWNAEFLWSKKKGAPPLANTNDGPRCKSPRVAIGASTMFCVGPRRHRLGSIYWYLSGLIQK